MDSSASATSDTTAQNCDSCKIRHERCDRNLWGCLSCAKRHAQCLYSTYTAKQLVNRRDDPTKRHAGIQEGSQHIYSADRRGHSSLTRSIVQIFDGALPSNAEIRQILQWKDGLWTAGASRPRPVAKDLVSAFPPLSTTHALVDIFLERVNPQAWLIAGGDVVSVVDKVYRDPPETHVVDLCSLLLILSVATHFQTPAATATIPIDKQWESTVLLYFDEVLSKAPQDALGVVRALVLLTLNGMGAKKNSCWIYHGLAVSLIESSCPDLSRESAESQSKNINWHRVVRTVYTLDSLLSVSFGVAPKFSNNDGPFPDPLSQTEDYDVDLPLHAAWFRLSRIVGDISRRIYISSAPSSEMFESILGRLENWRFSLPATLQPDVDSSSWPTLGLWERYLLIKLHMGYLNALILLLLPVLIAFARNNAPSSEIQNRESKLASMARLALETAVLHSRFASVRADEGSFISKSWMDVNGVFLASLTLILGGFWSHETHSGGETSAAALKQQQARDVCLGIIKNCGNDDPVSKVLSLVLDHLVSAVNRWPARLIEKPAGFPSIESQPTDGVSPEGAKSIAALQENEGIDLSSCSFFLVGGRSPGPRLDLNPSRS